MMRFLYISLYYASMGMTKYTTSTNTSISGVSRIDTAIESFWYQALEIVRKWTLFRCIGYIYCVCLFIPVNF